VAGKARTTTTIQARGQLFRHHSGLCPRDDEADEALQILRRTSWRVQVEQEGPNGIRRAQSEIEAPMHSQRRPTWQERADSKARRARSEANGRSWASPPDIRVA